MVKTRKEPRFVEVDSEEERIITRNREVDSDNDVREDERALRIKLPTRAEEVLSTASGVSFP